MVPDGLWENFQTAAPEPRVRVQGGGRRRCDDRAVLTAIIFVATSGCTWRQLPPVFDASWQTVHRSPVRQYEMPRPRSTAQASISASSIAFVYSCDSSPERVNTAPHPYLNTEGSLTLVLQSSVKHL
ncbi:transposase [Streptomyces sp. NPDC005395]|uniref:transposase n=1 Tax=Streptomyces sp. NPDC005395 TaxID=3157042 RepID=UPI002279B7BA|nr:transposase [Streptomyces sp. BSE6.1]